MRRMTLAVLLLLSACGQAGELYLPPEAVEPAPAGGPEPEQPEAEKETGDEP